MEGSADLVKIQSRRSQSGWKRIRGKSHITFPALSPALILAKISQMEVSALDQKNSETCHHKVEQAIEALRKGQGVLVTDNEDRENEGDLIFAADTLTNEQMAMLIRECSGIVCLCLPPEKVNSLGLSMMVENNTSRFQTAFTISIEAAKGVTTGVSAADRVKTVKAAVSEKATFRDISCPGHVFPLKARAGGVLERQGHTEATVDLMRLAGLRPYGVLCELTNPDGTMARFDQVLEFSKKHAFPVVTIDSLVKYRKAKEL
jgi:3,4-dihydroxy 2-butanone 4-phosphate synthase